MNPERWQKLGELFHSALECEPGERDAFIIEACAGEDELRKELESMIAHYEQAKSFIEQPAAVAAETLLNDDSDSLVGKPFGPYQIVGELGSGGMGVVYLAFDQELGRKVALKFLRVHLTEDKGRVGRFKQEARAASALNHPNILTVYQIGELDGRQFIATEFVEGETLRELMNRGPIRLREVLDVTTQIASALSAAHAAGIVHRDIKPENIMVRPDGYIKVLDFGVAKLSETSVSDSNALTLINTEQGMILGTVQYMSPEQARGFPVDGRSDIWSLGVVLYEMVTGRPPFAGATRSDAIAAILEREPLPLTSGIEGGSEALQEIVTRALTKDLEERYQTAGEVITDLRSLMQQSEVEADMERAVPQGVNKGKVVVERGKETEAPTSQTALARPTSSAEYVFSEIKQHKKGAVIVLATLAVAVAGIAFWGYKFTGRNASILPFQTMSMTRLTSSGRASAAAISPDGKYVAYVVAEPICCFQQSLWLRQIGTTSDIQIDPPSKVYHQRLTFSRDGNYLYYTDASNDLYQMPVIGGAKTKLMASVNSPISFSPDGKRFSFLRDGYPSRDEHALMVDNADGSGERMIALRKKPDFFGGGPAWSPNGKVIACAGGSIDSRGAYMNVVEVQVEGGEQKPITSRRWSGVGQVGWLSDGSGLVMLATDQGSGFSQQIWQLSYPRDELRRITNDFHSYSGISLTADSRMLVTEQETQVSNLWIVPHAKTIQARQITSGAGIYDDLSWTPDGQLLYHSNTAGNLDIWSMDVSKGNRKQLTIKERANGLASVSPDGRYVVFVSNRTGTVNLWRMDTDGGNPKQLTSGSGEDTNALCSPDGKWVVYESDHFGESTLWKVSIDGGDPVQLIDKPATNPAISPDGKWVVYESASGESTLWKVPLEGGKPVQLFGKPSNHPAISPDGKLIALSYADDPGQGEGKVAIIPFEGGKPLKVLDIPMGFFWRGVRWTPDGRALTYIDPHGGINILSQDLDGGPPKQVTDFSSEQVLSFAWSRTPKQLALVRGVKTNDVVLISDSR